MENLDRGKKETGKHRERAIPGFLLFSKAMEGVKKNPLTITTTFLNENKTEQISTEEAEGKNSALQHSEIEVVKLRTVSLNAPAFKVDNKNYNGNYSGYRKQIPEIERVDSFRVDKSSHNRTDKNFCRQLSGDKNKYAEFKRDRIKSFSEGVSPNNRTDKNFCRQLSDNKNRNSEIRRDSIRTDSSYSSVNQFNADITISGKKNSNFNNRDSRKPLINFCTQDTKKEDFKKFHEKDMPVNHDSEGNDPGIVFENRMCCYNQNISDVDGFPKDNTCKEKELKTISHARSVSAFKSNNNVESNFTKTTQTKKYYDGEIYMPYILKASEGNFIPPPTEAIDINISSNNGIASSSQKIMDSDASNTNDSCFSFPDPEPEHLEMISSYIKKVVTERSVNTAIAYTVVHDLNRLFKGYLEGAVIDLYGSYDTDLALSTSDINIVIKSKVDIRKHFMQEVQRVLHEELKKYHVSPFEEGFSATKIRIHFSEPKSGIRCQLAYLGKYHKNVLEMGKYLNHVCYLDLKVKCLIIAVKIWAEVCTINEEEDGKLHPIGFTLMMIHFLQQYKNPVLPILYNNNQKENFSRSDSSIGELWLAFLKYYAETFNWQQNVITVTSKEPISKKSVGWETFWIAIEDPFTKKNIARSVVNSDTAEYIKACFKAYYEYFANPPENHSVRDSTDDDSSNNENLVPSKFEYSFQHCFVDYNDNFCEMCDELDDICDECQSKNYVPPLPSLPKMTDEFLKTISKTLCMIYGKYILTHDEVKERENFVAKLEKEFQTIFQDAELRLFGSSVNGFGFKNSDLDICINFKTPVKNTTPVLKNLCSCLRRNKDFNNVFAIFNAQIPIIKFHYEPKKWRGDISLSNTLAVHNSRLLRAYSMLDERCRILGCCLKLIAKKAMIADTADKALSSYSYLIMVIHFLQQIEPPVLPILQDSKYRKDKDFGLQYIIEEYNTWFCEFSEIREVFSSANNTPVEQLWLELLDYYCGFDHKQIISIRQKEPLFIDENHRCARLFNIEDPFMVTKNLGCVVSAAKAQEMTNIFRRARYLFRNPIKELPSSIHDYEDFFFSTMSLTGRVHKEAQCDFCGKFGHEKKDCSHTNFAFKRIKRRPFRHFPLKYNRASSLPHNATRRFEKS